MIIGFAHKGLEKIFKQVLAEYRLSPMPEDSGHPRPVAYGGGIGDVDFPARTTIRSRAIKPVGISVAEIGASLHLS